MKEKGILKSTLEVGRLQTLIRKIQIDRSGVFWSIVLVLWVLSITVSKYFYYGSIEYAEKRRMDSYGSILIESSSTCMELSNQNGKYCLQKAINIINKSYSYYGQKVRIFGKYGAVDSVDSRKYIDRKSIVIDRRIDILDSEIRLETSPVPELYTAVFKGVFWSLDEYFKNPYEFKKYRAFARSAPVYSQLFLIIIAVWLLTQSIAAKIALVRKYEDIDKDEYYE